MPAKELTVTQKQDAARLKLKFDAWKLRRKDEGLPASQEDAAADLGFGQSALSQYLRGDIPLNPNAAEKFARLLGCSVADFSPDIAAELLKTWPFPSIERARFDSLTAAQKMEIQGAVRNMLVEFENVSRSVVSNKLLGGNHPSNRGENIVQQTAEDSAALKRTGRHAPSTIVPQTKTKAGKSAGGSKM
jgi:transcriptional regulator with XRE-family HTH domain